MYRCVPKYGTPSGEHNYNFLSAQNEETGYVFVVVCLFNCH